MMSETKFKGNILIYLDDNSVITCVDRGVKDRVNGNISAVYRLSNNEIEMIKKSNINGIRYSLQFMLGPLDSYLVYNSKFEKFDAFSLAKGDTVIPRVNFSEELKKVK
jgi:hypothetical protein